MPASLVTRTALYPLLVSMVLLLLAGCTSLPPATTQPKPVTSALDYSLDTGLGSAFHGLTKDRGVSIRILVDDGETVAGDERILALAAHAGFQVRIYNPLRYRDITESFAARSSCSTSRGSIIECTTN
jgi:hypothetical protein